MLVALLLVLSCYAIVPHAAGETSNVLYVTYVNVQPGSVHSGDFITIVFDVVYYTPEPYLGNIAVPAVGLTTATFLVGSNQTRMFSNVTLAPGSRDGEYAAQIQIPQDLTPGSHTLFVKAQSLQLTVSGKVFTGPLTDVGYRETETTSDFSGVQVIGTASILSRILASTSDLLLIALAIVIILLIIMAMFAHRKRTSQTSHR